MRRAISEQASFTCPTLTVLVNLRNKRGTTTGGISVRAINARPVFGLVRGRSKGPMSNSGSCLPVICFKVVRVHVCQSFTSRIPSIEIHFVAVQAARVKVPRRWWSAQAWQLGPRICGKIKSKKVRLTLHTIIASVDVNVGVVLGPGWAGSNRR